MTFTVSPTVYAAVFEHSLDAVFLTRPDGSILAANRAAQSLLGLTEDQICQRGRSGIIDPASPQVEWMLAEREQKGFARADVLYVHRDGTRIPVEVSSAEFTDDAGDTWTVVIARDIRDRRQAEEYFQRSQLLLETVVNSTDDFIWLADPQDFGVMWHNRAFEKYFAHHLGMTTLLGRHPADMFDDATLVRFWEDLYAQAIDQGSVQVEYHVSAGTHTLALTVTAIRRDGDIIGISAFGRDVTEASEARRRLAESEARYRTIVETLSEGVVFQAADGAILSVNPAAERIQSREEGDFLGRTSEDQQWGSVRADGTPFPGDEHPAMFTLRTGEAQQGVVMGILTPRGHRRWISINSAPVFDQGRRLPSAVVTTFHDITEQKRAEDELRISAIAFEASREAMVIAAPDTTILRVNRAFTEITGYSAAEAVGQTTRLLSSGQHDLAFYQDLWGTLNAEHRWQGEIWNRRRDGEVYPCWLSINAVTDEAGRVTHYVGTTTDLSEAKKAQQDIFTLAFYDTLTGLPNRRLLLDRLRQAVIGSGPRPHLGSLIFIDLDDFTILNETRGHSAGDQLLKAVAMRLQAQFGADDTVARIGSDEFAIVLDDLDPSLVRATQQAERAAHKLRSALAAPLQIDGQDYHCRTSVGIAMFGDGEPSEQDLLKHADFALTQARREGRDTVQFYNREVQAALEAHVALEAALRRAIPHDLRLLYQPQVDARGNVSGAEALIRWQDPERGMVSPAAFIPLAEDNGLILPIGQWVLETACRQLAAWQAEASTRDLSMSVNISVRQVHQADFTDTVLRALADSGADPTRLTLELTESMLVADLGDLAQKMTRLRTHGVSFSLDDFGTGYSSLRGLRELPLHELKIDQTFVRDIPADPNDLAIVRTIIGLGQSMGLSVIAEGVETSEQCRALAALGCARFQGYLFARPMPIKEFDAALRTNRAP